MSASPPCPRCGSAAAVEAAVVVRDAHGTPLTATEGIGAMGIESGFVKKA